MTYVTTTRAAGRSLDDLFSEADRLAAQFAGDRRWTIDWPTTIESGYVPGSEPRLTPDVMFSAQITITVEAAEPPASADRPRH